MKKILKDTFALFLITVIAGALLGLVYQITKEPIARQEELAAKSAYQSIFPMGESFDEVILVQEDGQSNELGEAVAKAVADEADSNGLSVVDKIVIAKDALGNKLGTILTVTNKEGYGGEIQITVGIDTAGVLQTIEILSISETAGLGMNAIQEDFRDNFKGLSADMNIVFVKDGADLSENEVDAISSATYTTKSIVHGANSAVDAYHAIGGESYE